MPNPLQEEPSNIQQDIHQSGDRGVVIGQSSGSIHIGDVYYNCSSPDTQEARSPASALRIQWTGPNQAKLREALIYVYRDVRSLKRFVKDNFEHDLYDLAESSVKNWAEDLIDKADAEGWIDKLYQMFCAKNTNHSRTAQLKQDLGDRS